MSQKFSFSKDDDVSTAFPFQGSAFCSDSSSKSGEKSDFPLQSSTYSLSHNLDGGNDSFSFNLSDSTHFGHASRSKKQDSAFSFSFGSGVPSSPISEQPPKPTELKFPASKEEMPPPSSPFLKKVSNSDKPENETDARSPFMQLYQTVSASPQIAVPSTTDKADSAMASGIDPSTQHTPLLLSQPLMMSQRISSTPITTLASSSEMAQLKKGKKKIKSKKSKSSHSKMQKVSKKPDRPLKGFGSGISFQSSDKDSVNSSDDDKHTQSIPSFGLSLSHISSSRTNAISSLSRLPSIES
ncbi:hypothetical protein ADUPG1_006843, partial [Aduncisulcus paluster]